MWSVNSAPVSSLLDDKLLAGLSMYECRPKMPSDVMKKATSLGQNAKRQQHSGEKNAKTQTYKVCHVLFLWHGHNTIQFCCKHSHSQLPQFSGFSAPVPTQLAVPVVLLKVAQSGWKNGGSNNFENSLRIVEDGCFIPPFVKVHKIRSSQNKNPKILIPDPGFKRITTAFPPPKKNTGVSWTHESIDS